ncbi:MAG: multidrug transporter [Firmicutes bacterium]|nr:multidrug transporter [Bacillota bacterium]
MEKVMEIKNSYLQTQEINVSLIMTTLKIGTFLALLNETIINVALSNLMEVFSVSANSIQWLTAGYMLIMGTFVPVTAYLIQRITTRQLFLSAMVIFLIGTVLAAAAQYFWVLLIGRLIQAVGTGVLLPLMMNTIMVLNPPEKRGSAMGSALLIVLFAPALGPTYAGLVMQTINWRWIFILIIPLTIISILIGWFYLKNITATVKTKLDIVSLILSTIGFGATIYGLNRVFSADSTGYLDMGLLMIGIAAIIAFTLRQLTIANPLLNVRAFSYPMFSLGIVLITITYMVLFANFVLMPMFIENILGLTIFQAGLAVLPGGIIGAILPPIFGKLYDRFGPRVIVPVGFAIMASANFFIAGMTSSTNIVFPVIFYCCVIIGLASLLTPSQTNTLNQLPAQYYSHGTAIMNTMMLIGSALGSSLFVGIMGYKQKVCLENNLTALEALSSGIGFAYMFVAALAAMGMVLSLFFRRKTTGISGHITNNIDKDLSQIGTDL